MKRIFIPLLLLLAAIALWSMSRSRYAYEDADGYADSGASDYAAPAASGDYGRHLPEMPDHGIVRLRINPIGGSLGMVFNDSNHVHLKAAKEIGIEPITDLRSAWRLKRPIVEVKSCADFFVDSLTHSYPFLVPEAATLLHDIGRAFNNELAARGGGSYRIKVTSVLRTPHTVGRLKRVNVNATSESAHQYGTTFDISHAKFICDSITVARSQEDLKNLLAEVIDSLRREGRLYVKHERKQGCFHITARRRI